MAASLDNDGEIEIRVATVDDSAELMKFLRVHYYRDEPLTAGCEPREPDAADVDFLLSNFPAGTCLMALHQGRIVGGAVAGPKTPAVHDEFVEAIAQNTGTKWGYILGILQICERQADAFNRYGVDKILHLHALGVDTALRGRRIGERLVLALIARGRELGYPLLTADCTSLYSARLISRLGFELTSTLPFTDYVDAAGQQLIRPPAPHERIQTFALRL
ncbi:hypothetical protein KR222_010615 [Zaprionus bogoriensis]|nr:hypothetical protein KR222_010615 [Zaprionus bogoriensis]